MGTFVIHPCARPWSTVLPPGDGVSLMLLLLCPGCPVPPPTSPHFSFQGSEASGDLAHLACSQVSHRLPPLQTVPRATFPPRGQLVLIRCFL